MLGKGRLEDFRNDINVKKMSWLHREYVNQPALFLGVLETSV